jgi:hypothetical protein
MNKNGANAWDFVTGEDGGGGGSKIMNCKSTAETHKKTKKKVLGKWIQRPIEVKTCLTSDE